MSQALTQFNPAGLPAHIANLFGDVGHEDLTSGAEAAFPVLSIKGKVWRVSHGGEQRVLQREGEPIQSIDVVIVAANRNLSKLYYAKAYKEGDDNPPDCSSANGITPDAGVQAPQSAACGTCQHNVWGSKITEEGKKGKACGDTRRVALIPERDMGCKTWGAPLLLRIPPGTFQALTEYARTQLGGRQYCAVVTRIGFDMMVAYPKITFKPLRYVTEDEGVIINRWRNDPIVARITGTDADPSAPNVQQRVIPIHPVAAPVAPAVAAPHAPVREREAAGRAFGIDFGAEPATPVAPAPASTAAPDSFAQSTAGPIAPAPAPAPVVVQAPVVDPLAGVPEALKAAILAVGGPETVAGKAILATLAPAPAKRTRRSKAEMEAVRAPEAAAPTSAVVPPVGQGWVPPVSTTPAPIQGELVARIAQQAGGHPATTAAANGAAPPTVPSGQEDLLAGVDALLAGLDSMAFDD